MMKPFLMKHSLLVCVLWLLACCTSAASKNYRYLRIMLVGTTGEDGPQCIHDTPWPAIDPIPHELYLNESCRSLNYALTHIQNDTTFIGIACGIHVLEPVGSSSDNSLLFNIAQVLVVGACPNGIPQIQCTDGAHLAFYNVQYVVVMNLSFQDCGKQLQHSGSLSDSSTLYFQDYKSVRIKHIHITITGPYGIGISLISNAITIAHGNVFMEAVEIYHFGIHGSGIHFEVLTSKTSFASENILLHNIRVENLNVNLSYNLNTTFTGISITVMGDGEGGGIALSDVTVRRTTRDNGISVALLDRVHAFNVQLIDTTIIGIAEWQISNNMTVTHITCDKPFSTNISKSAAINSTPHSQGIKIEVRGNSTGNLIQVEKLHIDECRGIPGSAFSLELTDESEENVVQLKEVVSSSGHERGLQVIVTERAKRNIIEVTGLYSEWHRAPCGAGAYIEFSGHAMGNLVILRNSSFFHNHALRGGSIACVCKNFATQNTFKVLDIWSFYNLVKLGGGVYVILQDFSNNNTILFTRVHTSNNTAYCAGAGVYIEFSGHAMGNLVILTNSEFHQSHALWGGATAVVCKDFSTQNTFKVFNIKSTYNLAKLGGGGYVILQGSSNKNTIYFITSDFSNNTAYCGGGMFIQIQDGSTASRVVVHTVIFTNNTLLPSEEHDRMGGGVHVEFSSVSATFRTGNVVNFSTCFFLLNTAGQGVGGAISVLYKHSLYQGDSGDSVIMDVLLDHNMARSGSACAFQSLPTHGKKLFKGVKIRKLFALSTTSEFLAMGIGKILKTTLLDEGLFYQKIEHFSGLYVDELVKQSISYLQEQFSQTINPSFQAQTSTNMIFTKSVQITVINMLNIFCGASSQGFYALDSEIVLQANSLSDLTYCVATHGGAIALYGESYIRVDKNATLRLIHNHAFQRGGAIYVSSPHGVVPMSNCFLQTDQEWEEYIRNVIFIGNIAKAEGQSVYVSDIQDCFSGSMQYLLKTTEKEIVSGPSHVTGATVDLSKPLTMCFIPGKQKQLPYTHANDDIGHNISSVFTVLINKMEDSIPVELDLFSKYTADFTVILHGIPQQHGMANYLFSSNTSSTSAVVKPPQLVLQSVDNNDLLLVMNIELRCCPPGYIFQYGSGDMGTCHCGMTAVIGIAECNETYPDMIGAVLERDHWAGYMSSNDRYSCNGQKLFTAPCPPGYCQMQQITLPENNSEHELQELVCTGSNRKGILCGDCLEGKGIAVNFNGIRPVCASCEEGLSNVGILVWILSEWVPMLVFMFVLMLFNTDLVSGKFNSFLLFAQLLAFSTIRGDAELGPVHNAFVRIYRFLYGMWNLDFFGVVLPSYCLTPHAHLTLLQTLLLHYSIGLFPLTVAITLTILERSAEKWICCHRVDQCLRRMRRWKAKYSDGMSYDRALPTFVILGFTRFLVSSSYILVHQTITGEDGEGKVVVWWQGSVSYGSIQHIAYFIPTMVILLVFVFLPSLLLLTLPIGPQLFGRLIIAVPTLRKLQRIQTFCSNVYTDRWVYHFVNVFQGCYKEHFRSFSSLYLFHRIVHLLVAVAIPRAEDALRIQIILTVALLLLIAICQPYNSCKLNILDAAILGNLVLILILNLHIADLTIPIGTRHFYASLQMMLIYVALLYPSILLGKKVYLKSWQLRCCQKQEEQREDNAETPLEAPAERLGNLVLITELRAGVPTSEDDDTVTETETET